LLQLSVAAAIGCCSYQPLQLSVATAIGCCSYQSLEVVAAAIVVVVAAAVITGLFLRSVPLVPGSWCRPS